MSKTSRRRMLQAYRGIKDDALRDLVSQCVNIHAKEGGGRTPKQLYRAVIDSFADKYGSEFESDYQPVESAEGAQSGSATSEKATSPMSLTSMTLHNFGSYGTETTIDLSPKGTRNVTAVVGSNGDGKSTLFYALNWALYGDDYLTELKTDKGRTLTSLINRAALEHALETQEPFKVSVQVSFNIRGTEHYIVRDFVVSPQGENFQVSNPTKMMNRITRTGQHEQVLDGTLDIILSIMPKHVRDFYFFDGEQINKFVSPNSQLHVRHAIRKVMQIDTLENTAADIAKVADDLRKEVKANSTGESERINSQLDEAHSRLAATRADLQKYEDENTLLNSGINRLDQLLEKSPDSRPLQRQRNTLEEVYKGYSEDRIRLAAEIRDLTVNSSLLLAGDAVSKLITTLDDRRERGVIPGPISEQLLKDLLERGTCICGTDIQDGTDTRKHLLHTLNNFKSQMSFAETALALFYEVGSLNQKVVKKAVELDKKRIELDSLDDRMRLNRSELETVSIELQSIPSVDRSGWEKERSSMRTQQHELGKKIALAEAEIGRLQKSIEELRAELKIHEDKESKSGRLSIRRHWAEAAEESLRNVYSTFATAARQDVEESTTELWRFMLPNINQYRVVVTEDFALKVVDALGNDAMQDLSMGQQQCLGLAFIAAVAQAAEMRPPLVIDMPFGRLGADVASSVARALPDLTEQLILFVLPDTEWNNQTKEALEPHLARHYRIQYDEAAQQTTIIAREGVTA